MATTRRNPLMRPTIKIALLIAICLLMYSSRPIGAYQGTPPRFEVDYARITMGGGHSMQGDLLVDDAITMLAGGERQTSDRFEVSSIKVEANNGIATAIGSNAARLMWTKSDPGAVRCYRVMRTRNLESGFSLVGTVDASGDQYTDNGLQGGTLYYYQVVIVGMDWSTTVLFGPAPVTTPMGVPLGAGRSWWKYD